MDPAEERLALIELLDREGRTLRVVDVWRWPVSLGRALDNTVVLDDPFVAAHHALLDCDAEGRILVRALPSRNGLSIGKLNLGSGETQALDAGRNDLRCGTTPLRIRLPGQPLADERALPRQRTPGLRLALLATLLLASGALGYWVGLDPGADLSTWLPLLLGAPLLLVVWCAGWALLSKLFQHHFDFWGHLGILLPWFLASQWLEFGITQAAASLGWAALWMQAEAATAVLGTLMVRAHLLHVLPQRGRLINLGLAALATAALAGVLVVNLRRHDRIHAAPYMGTLPAAALRFDKGVAPKDLARELEPLRGQLEARVRQAAKDDEADDSE